MKRIQKCDERSDLGRRKRSAIGRHVAATLNYLADDLIFGEMHGNAVERGTALAPESAERVTIVALLGLENERALAFERSITVDEAIGNFVGGPRGHVRTPGCIGAEMRERSQADGDNHQRKDANRTAIPTLFADTRDEWQSEQYAESNHWCDEDERRFDAGR